MGTPLKEKMIRFKYILILVCLSRSGSQLPTDLPQNKGCDRYKVVTNVTVDSSMCVKLEFIVDKRNNMVCVQNCNDMKLVIFLLLSTLLEFEKNCSWLAFWVVFRVFFIKCLFYFVLFCRDIFWFQCTAVLVNTTGPTSRCCYLTQNPVGVAHGDNILYMKRDVTTTCMFGYKLAIKCEDCLQGYSVVKEYNSGETSKSIKLNLNFSGRLCSDITGIHFTVVLWKPVLRNDLGSCS